MLGSLRLDGATPTDVAALRHMLRSDRRLDGARLTSVRQVRREEMGASQQLMQLVLGPESSGAFAAVLVAWIRSRTKRIKVHVETDKGAVDVDARNIAHPEAIAADIAQVLNE